MPSYLFPPVPAQPTHSFSPAKKKKPNQLSLFLLSSAASLLEVCHVSHPPPHLAKNHGRSQNSRQVLVQNRCVRPPNISPSSRTPGCAARNLARNSASLRRCSSLLNSMVVLWSLPSSLNPIISAPDDGAGPKTSSPVFGSLDSCAPRGMEEKGCCDEVDVMVVVSGPPRIALSFPWRPTFPRMASRRRMLASRLSPSDQDSSGSREREAGVSSNLVRSCSMREIILLDGRLWKER